MLDEELSPDVAELPTRKSKINTLTAFLLILIIALGTFTIYQSVMLHNNSNELAEAEMSISDYQDTILLLKETENAHAGERLDLTTKLGKVEEREKLLTKRIDELAFKEHFLDNYIAIITPTGKKYHKVDCHFAKDATGLIAYDIYSAENNGYEPCSVCHD